ncbi:MAG TPA: hypothetical protein VIL07_11110 [Symbiobacteriaceae bacterium]
MAWTPDEDLRQDRESSPEDPDEPVTWEPDETDASLEMGRRVTLVAVFREAREAAACADTLRQSGLKAAVTLFTSRPAVGENRPDGDEAGLGTGVAVGASIGATAGMLAATYVFPGLGGPLISASPTVTTLAGAGLGSLLGGLADALSEEAGQAAVLAVQVTEQDAPRAEAVVRTFHPAQVREVTP